MKNLEYEIKNFNFNLRIKFKLYAAIIFLFCNISCSGFKSAIKINNSGVCL